MKELTALFFILSIAFSIYGYQAEAYTNKAAFEKVRNEWQGNDYTAFSKSIDKHLTFKHKAQKYALTFAVCTILMIVLIKKKLPLKSASTKQFVIVLGLVSALLSLGAFWINNYWLQIHQLLPIGETANQVFLQKVNWLLVFYAAWLGIHATAFQPPYNINFPFNRLNLSYINVFYLSTAIMAVGFMMVCIVGGEIFYLLPTLGWVYFHLNILAAKPSSIPMRG